MGPISLHMNRPCILEKSVMCLKSGSGFLVPGRRSGEFHRLTPSLFVPARSRGQRRCRRSPGSPRLLLDGSPKSTEFIRILEYNDAGVFQRNSHGVEFSSTKDESYSSEDIDLAPEDVQMRTDGNLPSLIFSARARQQFSRPWRNALIVRLLGRSIGIEPYATG